MHYLSCCDDELMARVLIRTWMVTCGKVLREDVPRDELAVDELIDFWADEQMQEVPAGTERYGWLPANRQLGAEMPEQRRASRLHNYPACSLSGAFARPQDS